MPMPPDLRTEQMPWPSYPTLLKVTSSHEEGCERNWLVNTKEFIRNENQELIGIKIVDVEWKTDDNGKLISFQELSGTERQLPCQLALLSMGFLHPQQDGMVKNLGIELDNRGNVKAKEGVYQTNMGKVFAAGDMRRGQSLVVWAISEGREAARKVDEYLSGEISILSSKDITSYT